MAAKDFSSINTGRKAAGNTLYERLEQGTGKGGQQGTATPEEIARRKSSLKTQGRKGCKATRINMAFSTENHEFITVMARATGRTMTEFTNLVLDAYRNEHPEMMAQARSFLDTVNSGAFSKLIEPKEDTQE